MKIHHLLDAPHLLALGEHHLLGEPMLSEPGAFPGFKFFGGGRRPNPLVPLPSGADEILAPATGVVGTHEHLDGAARHWIRERKLPVWASSIDVPYLRPKRPDAHELCDGALGMTVEVIPANHGRGLLGWLMGPVSVFTWLIPINRVSTSPVTPC